MALSFRLLFNRLSGGAFVVVWLLIGLLVAPFSLVQGASTISLNSYQGVDPSVWIETRLAQPAPANSDTELAPAAAPALVYSSYLGGNSDEEVRAMARDSAGNLYVTGRTYSANFGGLPGTIAGSDDLFVAKFDPSGKTLLYRTLIGGKSGDAGLGIAVNAAGEVVVTASTLSLDFPLRNPLLDTKPEGNHSALLKLDAAGRLVFSTYLDIGFRGDQNMNIAFSPQGRIVFTGEDWAGASEGRENIGIYIIEGDGSQPVQLGQFGGDWIDYGTALAVGPDGKIYIAGVTQFRDGGFPLSTNAFQQRCGAKSYGASDPYCDDDAFVAVLNPSGTQILHATFLGGKGSEEVSAVGVDAAGNVYVAGHTYAQNFPVQAAFQDTWLGADNFSNGFISAFTPDLSALRYSTFLGAQDQYSSDFIYGMSVDSAGNLAVTGLTNGEYFPVKHAVQDQLDGTVCLGSNERFCYDAYISAFDPGGALIFSTYLGGSDDDIGYAIVGDGAGGYWVAGRTEASNFPVTPDAAQPRAMLQSDAFLAHLGASTAQQPGPQPGPKPFRISLPLVRR
jgi:DNA-binding beta-propeller fold protein YncE